MRVIIFANLESNEISKDKIKKTSRLEKNNYISNIIRMNYSPTNMTSKQ